jgi:predicted amidophosphoribosyltransferase
MPTELTFSRSDGRVVPLVPSPFCEYCCKPIRDDYADLGTCYDCNKNRLRVGAEPLEERHGKVVKWSVRDLSDLRPFFFRRAGAVGLYVKRASVLYPEIWQLKRGSPIVVRKIAALLAECMNHVLETRFQDFVECPYLVPVPSGSGAKTAPTRILAEALARICDRFSVLDALELAEGYASQRTMTSREARWENPRGKILVRGTTRRRLRAKRLLLIDDTFTEGATAHWSAKALLDQGCRQVDVLVVGRATDAKELEWIGYTGRV